MHFVKHYIHIVKITESGLGTPGVMTPGTFILPG